MAAEATLDEFEQQRERARAVLEACQKEHNLTSCLACEKLLECETRQTYVDTVYRSMSKGATGGFEF